MLSQTIVRIYAVRPRYLERFAIRLLAMTVPGPQSFEDLRRGDDGQLYDSFHEAAQV